MKLISTDSTLWPHQLIGVALIANRPCPPRHVIPGTLECYRYHGRDRSLPSSGNLPYHVVISTYGTVAADFKRGESILSRFYWHRLVLDEGMSSRSPQTTCAHANGLTWWDIRVAHLIRNHSTEQFSVVASLSAAHRWCMTGTPVQNSLSDLASLVRFLRVPEFEEPATFQRYITGRRTASGIARPNYRNLKLLLGSICLRRSTSTILSSLGVSSVWHRPRFSPLERKAYDDLVGECEKSIKAAINSRRTKKSNRSILTSMLRLRMFCNMGLANPAPPNPDANGEVAEHFLPDEEVSLLIQSGDATCSKCHTEIVIPDIGNDPSSKKSGPRRSLRCVICSQRDLEAIEAANNNSIVPGDPMEGMEISSPQTQGPEANSITTASQETASEETYPSKLIALRDDIREHYATDKRYDN